MRTTKIVLALLSLIVLTTCGGGGGHDVTGPITGSCDASFETDWHWTFQACSGFTTGISHGSLSTTNGCRLTIDVTPDAVKPSGAKYTMIVAFDQGTATLERKGSVCDAIDNGKITERNGHEYAFQFRASPTGGKCCENDYFVNLSF